MRKTIACGIVALAFGVGMTVGNGALAPARANDLPEQSVSADMPEMTLAQSDYVEHCGGCHGVNGIAAPANLPQLHNRVGWFMCTPEARAYLLHLPNIARSRLTDNEELADLLNFMIFGLGGDSVPKGARPFTGEEVARERVHPLTSVSLIKVRATLVDRLVKQCGAPASLRLQYPGEQPHPQG